MEPTNDGEKKPTLWDRIDRFMKKHEEAVLAGAVTGVAVCLMWIRDNKQLEARIKDDWWVVGVDHIKDDRDGRERVYVQHNNGYIHSFSKAHEDKD